MRITIASDFFNVDSLQFSLLRAALVYLVSETSDPAHADAVTAYRKVCSRKTGFSLQEGTAICIALCQLRELLHTAPLVSDEHPPAPLDNEQAPAALDHLISRLQARLRAHGVKILRND